jgi:23S rRNA-/tRNA-specific pseudouridylate synthase
VLLTAARQEWVVVRLDFETALGYLALAHDNLAASECVREMAQRELAVEREVRCFKQLVAEQAMARELEARRKERLALERAMARERNFYKQFELL